MLPHLLLGAVPTVLAALALRRSVRAPVLVRPWVRPWGAWTLDLLAALSGFALLLLASARPVVSALGVVAAAAGLVLTDQVKRTVLREPVVFADRAELLEVVRHPRLYLPFAGTGLVLGGAAVAVAGVAGLLWLEPPLFRWRWFFPPVALLIGVLTFVLPARRPLLPVLARLYRSWGVSGDPARDMQRLGMVACFIVHATLARAERPERQRLAAAAAPGIAVPPGAGSIVLVQSESLFDVGRLHPALGAALPGFNHCRAEAALHGRLSVPAWGANTVRSEFAALTGLDEAALGLDRFNPYAAFARVPLPSLATAARAAGYRTVCVHPFDLSFYGRRWVLPLLGFDELVGPEAFRDAERGGEWVSDAALARVVADRLRTGGDRLFVFVITMECHGPWDAASGTGAGALPPELAAVPGAAELARYLDRLRGADRLVPILLDALRARGGPGWLALFGDHLPTLPATFDALGLRDDRSDYLVWGTEAPPGPARDLAVHELGAAIGGLLGARQGAAAPPAVAAPLGA